MPRAAQEDGQLKTRLARQHPEDVDAYVAGKDAFVRHYVAQALAWRASK